jgi:DNA-binding winged helix-turn-helix (wHTH) protein
MIESNDAPLLVALTGERSGERWVVDRPLLIGRDVSCDITVSNRQVSRYHARLLPGKNGVDLEDMESKNGTHLNGDILTGKSVLKDGDTFLIATAQEFQFLNSDATMPLSAKTARLNRLLVDFRSRQVWVNNKQLNPPLSAQQFLLLFCLYENEGKVISRNDLIVSVWGSEQSSGVSEQALDALIRRLRDRLNEIDHEFVYIVTVRGHGIKLDNPPMASIFE